MSYLVTTIYADRAPETRIAIGDRDSIMDAAYDDGALGVTIMVRT